MSNELERLKTTCLAQEAEIARLQSGFDDLRKKAEWHIEDCSCNHPMGKYALGWFESCNVFLDEINRITGVEK